MPELSIAYWSLVEAKTPLSVFDRCSVLRSVRGSEALSPTPTAATGIFKPPWRHQ